MEGHGAATVGGGRSPAICGGGGGALGMCEYGRESKFFKLNF